MSAHPATIALRWLYAHLAGDAALIAAAPGGVHEGPAPAGTPYPLVRLRLGKATNVSVVNGVVVMARVPVDVAVVAQGRSYAACEAAAARLTALLHRQSGSATGGTVLSCLEMDPLAYPELATGGAEFRHLGATYELLVQSTGA